MKRERKFVGKKRVFRLNIYLNFLYFINIFFPVRAVFIVKIKSRVGVFRFSNFNENFSLDFNFFSFSRWRRQM